MMLVFPTGQSSIQFEYHKPSDEYLELEIFEDRIEAYRKDQDESWESEVTPERAVRLVDEFHKA